MGSFWSRACRRGSRLALVEHEYVDAASREVLHVGDGGLPFRAREGLLDRGHVVESQESQPVW